MSRYKPLGSTSPWEMPKPGDYVTVDPSTGKIKGFKPSKMIVDESSGTHDSDAAMDFKRMSEKLSEVSRAMKVVGNSADQFSVQISLAQERMILQQMEMELKLKELERQQKLQEEAELQEGIAYVMRSLGVEV